MLCTYQALTQTDFDVGIPILGTLNLGTPKIHPGLIPALTRLCTQRSQDPMIDSQHLVVSKVPQIASP